MSIEKKYNNFVMKTIKSRKYNAHYIGSLSLHTPPTLYFWLCCICLTHLNDQLSVDVLDYPIAVHFICDYVKKIARETHKCRTVSNGPVHIEKNARSTALARRERLERGGVRSKR